MLIKVNGEYKELDRENVILANKYATDTINRVRESIVAQKYPGLYLTYLIVLYAMVGKMLDNIFKDGIKTVNNNDVTKGD